VRRGFAVVLASVIVAMVLGVGAAWAGLPSGVRSAASSDWKVGDCYTGADVANDEVTLASRVPCTDVHAVQILAGAPLPKALAKVPYRELRDQQSKAYKALTAFSTKEACTNIAVAKGIYPEKGAAIGKALERVKATEVVPGVVGSQTGFVLPDQAAFDAGAKDVLCVVGFSTDFVGTPGDIRELETSATVANLRNCQDFPIDEVPAQPITCDGPHDFESLIFVGMSVAGQPKNPLDWKDRNWAKFDKACSAIAGVLIGGTHSEFQIRADTDPAQDIYKGMHESKATSRLFQCKAQTPKEGEKFPAGTVVGLGDRKATITPAP